MAKLDYIDIPFGAYLPDLGGAPNPEMPGYLVDAVGVRLTPNGYRGLPIFSDVSSATASSGTGNKTAVGMYTDTVSRGVQMFEVSENHLVGESLDEGVTWANVTPAVITPQPPGDFIQFGGDAIYVCANQPPISKTLGNGGAGVIFAALAGSPPSASCGARVRQHVVLGALSSVDQYAVQWSAIGTHTDWPTPGSSDARAKQSGRQTLSRDCGLVTNILGGEKIGIVVQNSGLTRMTYVGGDGVYDFDTFNSSLGSGYRKSSKFVTDGSLWYWHNDDGFWATDGYSAFSLSQGKIDDAIFGNLLSHPNGSSLPATNNPDRSAVYDFHRRIAIFGTNESDYQLVFSQQTGSFSWMNEPNVLALFLATNDNGTQAYFDRQVHNINDSSEKLQRLGSGSVTVAMQTGFIEIDPGYRVQIEGVHLLGANGMGSLTLAYKAADDYTSMTVAQTGFTSLAAASRGMKNQGRATAQFFAFRITGTGAESQLLRGIRIYYSRAEPSQ